MSSIIYSKMEGTRDPLFGKFEHPIKALIESESDNQEKLGGIRDTLFNVEKSNRYAETVMGESDFGDFQALKEGQGAENDSTEVTYKKTIEHIAFAKEFTITKEMADDAKFGMGAEMKNKPRGFVRAYYRTMNRIAAQALINGTSTSMLCNKAKVDLSVGDGLALFSNAHTYANLSGTQSNYFCNAGSGTALLTAAGAEGVLTKLANKMRNFKDENGEPMGYVPDVIVIPCNRPGMESIIRKTVGSERSAGTNYNDINIQYGQYSIVVLDGWEASTDQLLMMSSRANEELMGNMFYNRVPLDIRSGIDDHTRNMYWNGYCRFGVGFTTWKHILKFDDSTSDLTGSATSIAS